MNIKRRLYQKWLRLYARMAGEKATPEYIARGWAIGMFFGCASPFGFQLVFSIPAAFLLKGSRTGSVLGTLLTNHFTIFFIYPLQCYVGNRILGGTLTYPAIRSAMENVLKEQSMDALMRIGSGLVAAFFLGGFLLAAVTTPLTYWGVKRLVEYRRKVKARRGGGTA